MKCPKCEKQNKAGAKNCEFCNEVMPVRKKKATTKQSANSIKNDNKSTTAQKKSNITKAQNKIAKKKPRKDVNEKPEIVKEPIIELSDEKKAIKRIVKKVKKINKMIYVYILLVLSVLFLILMLNNKLHTVSCTINHNSETEKYNITLKIKKSKNNIVGFKYITKNTTNSYDKELESRYNIIVDELKKKKDFNDIVSSSLRSRSWKITYEFNESNLDKTTDYIGIDLTGYTNDVESLVKELEKEVGFTCK